MQIISAFHILHLGRTLRINTSAKSPAASDAVLFTRCGLMLPAIGEKIRIATEETAKSLGLRKYLRLFAKSSITAGPFDLFVNEVSEEKTKINITINNSLFFLTFLPKITLPLHDGTTLLLPADSTYFAESDLPGIKEFIKKSAPKNVILSGDLAEEWLPQLSIRQRSEIRNEIVQQDLFN